MSGVFRFKQFEVDQTGCAMKINTDGALLGAIAGEGSPQNILDIGTGTGVIALMLAQRFAEAKIDAVEIDNSAVLTAGKNFKNSPFDERLTVYDTSFTSFFEQHSDKKYSLIVSNPPFYINSLASPQKERNTAKHAGKYFFKELMQGLAQHLTPDGQCWLVLPVDTAALVKDKTADVGLHLQKIIEVKSFENFEPHREIVVFGLMHNIPSKFSFVIYSDISVYSDQYIHTLKDFFTIF
ncbi:methyltransferase domain-containing protein [Mucilaginibacter limnophilus]|uniref:tRNA1(Val) (adenine(37)-N6)-methyltransferase n=1 Tax=Mucilaginibacter limnophilus TaxID=1932778 RepID=A0A437MZD9_9SPHI|nr:methyltransferase [Mucilaginibacter limnophilus]RVU02964.1 methyltransferase domain-containing protein [Mucilaginibacter limnophilus]